jgi:hypothetical protein
VIDFIGKIESALLGLTYRTAGIAYLAIVSLITLWFLCGGKVIAPHVQDRELALPASQTSFIQNREFNDYYLNFIPELQQQITSPHSGWIATWSRQNELGRPLYHSDGLSPAFTPTWLLMRLSSDPFVIITMLSLFTAFLGGAFAFLLSREWGYHPLASLCAALLLASSPMVARWATFSTFFAVYCWGTGIMWAFQRATKRREAWGWLVLVFCVYALLMTAYPQMVVHHGYLIGIWSVVVFWRVTQQQGACQAAKLAVFAASAVLVGALFTLPTYLDLWNSVRESARLNVPVDFFTARFPNIKTWQDATQWLVTLTIPDLFGNPSAPDYPFFYNGRSLNTVPWVWLLALSSILLCLRKTWGWWLAIIICITLVLSKPLYHFGVAHLGFGISRGRPLYTAVLPMLWLAVSALDSLFRLARPSRENSAKTLVPEVIAIRSMWIFPIAVFLAVLTCAGGLALATGHSISGKALCWSGLTALAFVLLCEWRYALAAVGGVMLAVFAFSWPLVLVQDISSIKRTSPLVEAIRANLPEGSRFAWLSEPTALLSNANATIGLATVHSYNSLSPKSYHTLIDELGGKMLIYGRHNKWISLPEKSTALQFSNISLFLSSRRLPENYGIPLALVGGVFLYKNADRIGGWLRIPLTEARADGTGYRIEHLEQVTKLSQERLRDAGDVLEFTVTASPASLIVLSQKYHSQWLAEWWNGNTWNDAPSVRINGFFQGAVIPQEARSVRFSFRPWVRFAWFAHAFFFIAGGLLILRMVLKKWVVVQNYQKHNC